MSHGAFKSCQIHCIYELIAHIRHHKVIITSGKLNIFFKPRFSKSVKNHIGCNGHSQRLKICSASKVVESNTIMIFFLVLYNKSCTIVSYSYKILYYCIIIIEYIIIQLTSPS